MKWMKRNKQQQNQLDSQTEQAIDVETQKIAIARPARRRMFGLLKAGLGASVVVTGVATFFKESGGSAHADSVGSFSSTVVNTPAVSAFGANGALGIQVYSDASTAISANSTTPQGSSPLKATLYSGNSGFGPAIVGESNNNWGMWGKGGSIGVYGTSLGSSSSGLYGSSGDGLGVTGDSIANIGVRGSSSSSTGVYGVSSSGDGVYASSTSGLGAFLYSQNNTGAFIYSSQSTGLLVYGNPYAATFYGNMYVSGSISKGGGSFLIDHPLDPANKNLSHSFVESPDMKNIYDGVVQLDTNGEAVVILPDWFSALNSDFRYQLTAIGPSKSVLYIDQEISNNQFKIGGGTAGMKVSWQVTGIRQDAWANAHRIPVEENKPASSRGLYHHPELFGHHKEKGIAYHAAPVAPIAPTSANTIPPTKP